MDQRKEFDYFYAESRYICFYYSCGW